MILVDMDGTSDIRYKILVKRQVFAFFIDVEYENLPTLCSHCKKLGHSAETCRIAQVDVVLTKDKDNAQVKKVFVPKSAAKKENVSSIPAKPLIVSNDNLVVPVITHGCDFHNGDSFRSPPVSPFKDCNENNDSPSNEYFVDASIKDVEAVPLGFQKDKDILVKY